jgi:hypothetical protein
MTKQAHITVFQRLSGHYRRVFACFGDTIVAHRNYDEELMGELQGKDVV